MTKKKSLLANMDAGKSLRLFMAEQDLQAKQLAETLGISDTTMSTLRRSKLISGSNLVMLSDYFGVTAANFIRKGESEVS
tara:strand:- start:129 stop:368 length:240 start_codon:yes stop_codon:yes gene_type:complete